MADFGLFVVSIGLNPVLFAKSLICVLVGITIKILIAFAVIFV